MSAAPAPPREEYHHGRLAEAALEEGLRALEAGEELSMRAIARAVGVANRALFNHYPDRAAFEAALSAQGFRRLAHALEQAATKAAFLRAYVAFALAHAALYALMMRQSYPAFEGHPELRAAADQVIAAALRVLAPNARDAEDGRRTVMRLWMIAHGGVGLHRSGVLRARTDADFAEELLRIAGVSDDESEQT
jgi:AcrR family transcriptional regulator